MNKIRLIEGYHDRKNIQYYRDYEIKNRDNRIINHYSFKLWQVLLL